MKLRKERGEEIAEYGRKKAIKGVSKVYGYARGKKKAYKEQRQKELVRLRELNQESKAIKHQQRLENKAKRRIGGSIKGKVRTGVRKQARSFNRSYKRNKNRNDLKRKYPYQMKKLNIW